MTTSDPNHPNRQNLKGKAAVEGILGGLGDILGKISELADKADAAQRDGAFKTQDGREGRFQVGFNIRTMENAGGERTVNVEPFGDVQRDRSTGEASVSERREPPTDVFEEHDHVLVVVEMPGVGEEHASFAVDGDVLTITAENGPKRYHKEVLLPRPFNTDDLSVRAVNGVFEVRLVDTAGSDTGSDSEAA